MTRVEFAKIMAFLAEGSGKPLSAAGHEVYLRMLGDLPVKALEVAAQQALLEPLYGQFPTIGALRRLATQAMGGPLPRSAGEAWASALVFAGAFHGDQLLANCGDEYLMEAVRQFGWEALKDLTASGMNTARAQFMRIYDGLVAKRQEQGMLPPAVKKELEALAPPVKKLLGGVWKDTP